MNTKLIVFIVSVTAAGYASAATYVTECDTCSPFDGTSASVQNAAVAAAQNHGAVVNDTIAVQHCSSAHLLREADFTVNSTPVTNSANLTYVPPLHGEPGGC